MNVIVKITEPESKADQITDLLEVTYKEFIEVCPYLNMNDLPDARDYSVDDITNGLYHKDLKRAMKELGFDVS